MKMVNTWNTVADGDRFGTQKGLHRYFSVGFGAPKRPSFESKIYSAGEFSTLFRLAFTFGQEAENLFLVTDVVE